MKVRKPQAPKNAKVLGLPRDDEFVLHGDGSPPHDTVRERQMGEEAFDPLFIEQMMG